MRSVTSCSFWRIMSATAAPFAQVRTTMYMADLPFRLPSTKGVATGYQPQIHPTPVGGARKACPKIVVSNSCVGSGNERPQRVTAPIAVPGALLASWLDYSGTERRCLLGPHTSKLIPVNPHSSFGVFVDAPYA